MSNKLPTTLTDIWEDTWTPASEAARLLGVCAETVRNWVDAGKLRGKKLGGKWLMVHLDDVRRVADERVGDRGRG